MLRKLKNKLMNVPKNVSSEEQGKELLEKQKLLLEIKQLQKSWIKKKDTWTNPIIFISIVLPLIFTWWVLSDKIKTQLETRQIIQEKQNKIIELDNKFLEMDKRNISLNIDALKRKENSLINHYSNLEDSLKLEYNIKEHQYELEKHTYINEVTNLNKQQIELKNNISKFKEHYALSIPKMYCSFIKSGAFYYNDSLHVIAVKDLLNEKDSSLRKLKFDYYEDFISNINNLNSAIIAFHVIMLGKSPCISGKKPKNYDILLEESKKYGYWFNNYFLDRKDEINTTTFLEIEQLNFRFCLYYELKGVVNLISSLALSGQIYDKIDTCSVISFISQHSLLLAKTTYNQKLLIDKVINSNSLNCKEQLFAAYNYFALNYPDVFIEICSKNIVRDRQLIEKFITIIQKMSNYPQSLRKIKDISFFNKELNK